MKDTDMRLVKILFIIFASSHSTLASNSNKENYYDYDNISHSYAVLKKSTTNDIVSFNVGLLFDQRNIGWARLDKIDQIEIVIDDLVYTRKWTQFLQADFGKSIDNSCFKTSQDTVKIGYNLITSSVIVNPSTDFDMTNYVKRSIYLDHDYTIIHLDTINPQEHNHCFRLWQGYQKMEISTVIAHYKLSDLNLFFFITDSNQVACDVKPNYQ